MAKRSVNCRDEQGTWDNGGGGLDFGDSVEETLRKEIREEYCTEVVEYEFLGFRDIHREHAGRKTHWITLDFVVRVDPVQVKIGEPHKFDDIGWFKIHSLPAPLHSQVPALFEKYHSQLPGA